MTFKNSTSNRLVLTYIQRCSSWSSSNLNDQNHSGLVALYSPRLPNTCFLEVFGPLKYTDQTPNLRRYIWKTRVGDDILYFSLCKGIVLIIHKPIWNKYHIIYQLCSTVWQMECHKGGFCWWFFTDSTMVDHHVAPPFGRICFMFFSNHLKKQIQV